MASCARPWAWHRARAATSAKLGLVTAERLVALSSMTRLAEQVELALAVPRDL